MPCLRAARPPAPAPGPPRRGAAGAEAGARDMGGSMLRSARCKFLIAVAVASTEGEDCPLRFAIWRGAGGDKSGEASSSLEMSG